MKLQPKLFCILLVILITTTLSAQDLIIRTDGSKIFCRIITLDSAFISYMQVKDKIEQKIARKDVSEYYISKKKTTVPATPVNSVSSQQHEVFIFSVFAGRPMPMGKFASKDMSEDDSGLALDGFMLGAGVTLKVVDEFGFNFSYISQSNRFDELTLASALNDAYPNGGFTVKGTPWQMRGFFLGTQISLKIKRVPGLSIRIEPRGGFPRYFQPKISTRGRINGMMVGIDSEGDTVRAITFNLSAGFVYKFAEHVAFTVDLDYFSAKPYFTGRQKNLFGNVRYYSFEQPYKTLTPRLGFSFLFGNRKSH